jgi:hypothetical protein
MSTAEGSVVKEILNCIRAVCEKQRQLSSVDITQRDLFIEEGSWRLLPGSQISWAGRAKVPRKSTNLAFVA